MTHTKLHTDMIKNKQFGKNFVNITNKLIIYNIIIYNLGKWFAKVDSLYICLFYHTLHTYPLIDESNRDPVVQRIIKFLNIIYVLFCEEVNHHLVWYYCFAINLFRILHCIKLLNDKILICNTYSNVPTRKHI